MTATWVPCGLPVHAVAVANTRLLAGLDPQRVVALPDPKPHARRARLPSLGEALARTALGERAVGDDTGVVVATAYGCLTETAVFVENLIAQDGAAPAPRAFTNSVHNAIASSIARALGARGECHTFVQGAVGFAHALFTAGVAQRGTTMLLVGALDEWTDYVARGHAVCAPGTEPSEGGAMLVCGGDAATVVVGGVAFGRGSGALPAPVDLVFADPGVDTSNAAKRLDLTAHVGSHPARGAVATACAVELVAGRADPAAFGLAVRPRSVGIAVASRFGDVAVWTIEAAR